MDYDMQKRAKLRCMHLLERRDYTEKELRDKLRTGKTSYTEEQIEGAISYVKSFRYVNDSRYAEKYIASMSERKSRKQIEMELYRKGLDKELVDLAFDDAEEIQEEEQIEKWMKKKGFDLETSDPKDKQKMYAFLMRKGFQSENIRRAMRVEYD